MLDSVTNLLVWYHVDNFPFMHNEEIITLVTVCNQFVFGKLVHCIDILIVQYHRVILCRFTREPKSAVAHLAFHQPGVNTCIWILLSFIPFGEPLRVKICERLIIDKPHVASNKECVRVDTSRKTSDASYTIIWFSHCCLFEDIQVHA